MLKQFSLVFLVFFGCYTGINSEELKRLTNELEVNVPAIQVWKLYRNLGIANLAAQKFTNVIQSLEVSRGDGRVRTLTKIDFNAAIAHEEYNEQTIDSDIQSVLLGVTYPLIGDSHETYSRNVEEVLEGDYRAIGCSVQIIQYDIIENSQNSSIIKSDISYAVKKEFEAKDPKPNIQLLAAIAQLAKEFLEKKNKA